MGQSQPGAGAIADATAGEPPRLLLLGASIGKGWDLARFHKRTGFAAYRCESVACYRFDKSEELRHILERERGRPAVVILKECATYFPGDLARYQQLTHDWVEACRRAGVTPVLATVIPVVDRLSWLADFKKFVKVRLLGRPDQNVQVARYNDWLRQFARQQSVEVLDLERAVRVGDHDRTLRPDLHVGDGLHLNARGYALLDQALVDFLAARR